jgi:FdhD protein
VANKTKALKRVASGAQTVAAEVWRWRLKGRLRRAADRLAAEEPLEIRVRGRSVAVTMRTPGRDAELAAGFLLTEGLVRKRADVIGIAPSRRGAAPENTVNIFLAPSIEVDFDQLTRHVFASSSCGLCGKASIDAVHLQFPPVESRITMDAKRLLELPRRLRAAQVAFNQTGGLHAAAISNTRGRLTVLREDVGRHNAVDKVIGYGFLADLLPFDRHILMVSGRASFEILQKALAARIPIVCAVSAPSSLAVEFAQESGQTLVGFLRNESFNIYSHPERIGSGPGLSAQAE